MLVVGLTGGIATGKSTASAVFSERGIPVIDADKVAREVVEPGEPGWLAIRKQFGSQFFNDENGGVLLREKLGRHIFISPEKRRLLNDCTHPFIRRRMFWQFILHFLSGARLVILDTPLLFEVGYDRILSRTIVVWCSPEQELERLIARDGLSEEDAKARVSAQMPLEDKKKRATMLIDNTGSKEELARQLNKLVDDLERSWTPLFIRTAIATVFVGLLSLAAFSILSLML